MKQCMGSLVYPYTSLPGLDAKLVSVVAHSEGPLESTVAFVNDLLTFHDSSFPSNFGFSWK